MFEFLIVIGAVLAYYGYSVLRNPRVWGEQGREQIKEDNWNGYVVQNGKFFMYSGLLLAGLAALDVIFNFSSWLYLLILLGGLVILFMPLLCWMHDHEGKWWPWPKKKKKKNPAEPK